MIDADAFKTWIDEYVSVFKKSDKAEIKGYISHQPSINIVTCGECKQRTDRDYKVWGKGFCEMLRGWTKDDDYCAWGEREGE